MSSSARSQTPYGLEPGIVERLTPGLFAGLETRIEHLHRLRTWRRLQDFAFYASLWALGAALISVSMERGEPLNVSGITGVVLAGLGLNGFVLLVHDGMHGVLLGNSRLNRLASVLLSYTHLMSFTAYQVLHIRHHKHVGVEGDPDHYANYVESKPLVWVLNAMRLVVAAFLYLVAIPTLAWWHGNAAVRGRLLQEYAGLAVCCVLAAIYVPGDILLWMWFVPMLIVAVITQIRAFAQHTLTDPSDPLLAARSMRPWPVISYVMLHENYHLEHHLFPRVPSYNLPALSALIEARLPRAVVGSSYLALILRYARASLTLDETPVVVRETPVSDCDAQSAPLPNPETPLTISPPHSRS